MVSAGLGEGEPTLLIQSFFVVLVIENAGTFYHSLEFKIKYLQIN